MKNARWKQELIALSRQKVFWGELLVILAYVTLTLITYHTEARLAVHLPFDGIVVFAPLFVGGFLLLFSGMEFSVPVFLLLPAARLTIFLFSGLIGEVGADMILEQVAMTLLGMTIFLLFFNYRNGRLLFRRALIAFAVVADVQLVTCVIGLGSNYSKTEVLAGIGYSNYVATFLIIVITFLLFSRTNRVEKGVLVLSVLALLLTMSVGAFVALFVVFCVWYWKKMTRNPKPYILILVLVLVLLILFGILASQITALYRLTRPIWSKLQQVFAGDFDGVTSLRFTLYRYSWRSILRRPLFGAIINYNEVSAAEGLSGMRTHNLILESLLLYGFIGSLCNVGILATVIRRGRAILKERPGRKRLVFVFVVMLIHGFVEPNFFTILYEMFVWAMIGLFLSPHPAEDDYVWNDKRFNSAPDAPEATENPAANGEIEIENRTEAGN